MPAPLGRTDISVEDYLAGEEVAEVRHEYVNGAVYAMVGVTKTHNRLTKRLARLIDDQLEDRPCESFVTEVKTHILALNDERFYYPDLLVECEPYTDDERFCDHPVLVIEILSQSTERYDRSDKFYGYRKVPSLLEYVMVTQDEPRVEVYRRDRGWDLEVYGAGENLRLEAIDAELAVDDVYAGILSIAA
jgi:Uma2 family endonuclease